MEKVVVSFPKALLVLRAALLTTEFELVESVLVRVSSSRRGQAFSDSGARLYVRPVVVKRVREMGVSGSSGMLAMLELYWLSWTELLWVGR